ncbi:hypothetical protein D3C76_1181390 [compost metagenome]
MLKKLEYQVLFYAVDLNEPMPTLFMSIMAMTKIRTALIRLSTSPNFVCYLFEEFN